MLEKKNHPSNDLPKGIVMKTDCEWRSPKKLALLNWRRQGFSWTKLSTFVLLQKNIRISRWDTGTRTCTVDLTERSILGDDEWYFCTYLWIVWLVGEGVIGVGDGRLYLGPLVPLVEARYWHYEEENNFDLLPEPCFGARLFWPATVI